MQAPHDETGLNNSLGCDDGVIGEEWDMLGIFHICR